MFSGQLHFLSSPKVFRLLRAMQAQLRQAQMERMRGIAVVARIQHRHRQRAARQVPRPHLHLAVAVDARTLLAQRVLVDGDHFAVGQDRLDLRLHVGQVVAGQQRRGQHGPHRKVRAVLSQR